LREYLREPNSQMPGTQLQQRERTNNILFDEDDDDDMDDENEILKDEIMEDEIMEDEKDVTIIQKIEEQPIASSTPILPSRRNKSGRNKLLNSIKKNKSSNSAMDKSREIIGRMTRAEAQAKGHIINWEKLKTFDAKRINKSNKMKK